MTRWSKKNSRQCSRVSKKTTWTTTCWCCLRFPQRSSKSSLLERTIVSPRTRSSWNKATQICCLSSPSCRFLNFPMLKRRRQFRRERSRTWRSQTSDWALSWNCRLLAWDVSSKSRGRKSSNLLDRGQSKLRFSKNNRRSKQTSNKRRRSKLSSLKGSSKQNHKYRSPTYQAWNWIMQVWRMKRAKDRLRTKSW